MRNNNFYRGTDITGRLPSLHYTSRPPLTEAWVQYVDNKPVRVKLYRGQTRVWDYSTNTFRQLDNCPNVEVFK